MLSQLSPSASQVTATCSGSIINVFQRDCHWSIFCVRLIQSAPSYPTSIRAILTFQSPVVTIRTTLTFRICPFLPHSSFIYFVWFLQEITFISLYSVHELIFVMEAVFSVRYELNVFSYVYCIVHHLDSWIKIDQLDVTCFIISLFTA